MKQVKRVCDANGQKVYRGDMVTSLNDHVTSKIMDMCRDIELETEFVRLRPQHQSMGKGIWHAAEHVLRLRAGRG